MTNAYHSNLKINYQAIEENKIFLEQLSNELQTRFQYLDKDKMIAIELKNPIKPFVALFETDFEYKNINHNDVKKYIRTEIDRLAMLSGFNPQIPNLKELIELENSI